MDEIVEQMSRFDTKRNVCNHLISKAKKKGISLNRLPPGEKIVLKMRAKGETLESIGQELGVTREHVRQIEFKALKLLNWYVSEKEGSLISDVFTNRRTLNALWNNGIDSVGDLVSLTPKQFLTLKNCGKKTFEDAQLSLLTKCGIFWR